MASFPDDGLPRLVTPVPGPRSSLLAEALRRAESRNVTFLAPDFPVFWDSAQGCLVRDADGNTFLDMTAAFGVAAVGHSHAHVVRAVQAQAGKLLHGMGDVHPSAVKAALCERIKQLIPLPDARVILGQNGADAVEAALKTAALYTGKRSVLAFHGGYHGLSYGALDVTARADFRRPFLFQLGHFTSHLSFGGDLDDIAALLQTGQFGAVLCEPVQGRGGIVEPPAGWLPGLRELCTRHGALLILDEIFTGWGRTGDWFACQFEKVTPDILCVGKAMGGGLPISACVAPAAVMDAWPLSAGEALHTSTFLGNPLACAASLAALHILERDTLPARAKETGAYFAHKLRGLHDAHPDKIMDVRGRGLMLGLAFASRDVCLALVPAALHRGLIVLPAGAGDVLEFVPPLTVSRAQIEWCVHMLDGLLHARSKPV